MTTNTGESMVALQPNMQVHDDLAALFSRNLTLTNQQNYDLGAELLKQVDSSPAPTNTTTNITSNDVTATEPEKPQNVSSPIVYSISQHYHHSGHIARPKTNDDNAVTTEPPARPSSEPCVADAVETLLAANGIDPTVLNPPQIQLFRIADDEQKLRLMELWRICPPENNASASGQQRAGDDTWTGTSLEREEMLARMRWEKAQEAEYIQSQLLAEAAALARTQHHDSVMSLDGTMIHNAQQIQQQEDGRWLPYEHMEPYMMSGYEEIMRREAQRQADEDEKRRQAQEYVYKPATDPVYRDAGGVGSLQWQMQMENQYGAFEQFRGQAGAMDAMEIL